MCKRTGPFRVVPPKKPHPGQQNAACRRTKIQRSCFSRVSLLSSKSRLASACEQLEQLAGHRWTALQIAALKITNPPGEASAEDFGYPGSIWKHLEAAWAELQLTAAEGASTASPVKSTHKAPGKDFAAEPRCQGRLCPAAPNTEWESSRSG